MHCVRNAMNMLIGERGSFWGIYESIYPDGKLQDGRQIDFSYMDVAQLAFIAHDHCFACVLCGSAIKDADHGFCFKKHDVPVAVPAFEITCKSPPGSTGWCSNDIDSYKKALKRLDDAKSMAITDIQGILEERQVPWKDDEEKASLICKVIVTDKKKGKKTAHIVTRLVPMNLERKLRLKSVNVRLLWQY